MSEQKLTVSTHLDAPVEKVWDVLVHPSRHHEADASGMVGATKTPGALASVGQVFRMAMSYRKADGTLEHYETDNHVVAFEPLRLLAWRTAAVGRPPFGWEWRYDLRPAGDGGTDVTLTQDYGDCPAKYRERFGLPGMWSEDDFHRSLLQLGEAAGAAPEGRR